MGNNEPVSIADEIPFEIPENWAWCRCSSLGTMIRGKGIKRTETVKEGFPCVRYGEIYTSYTISFDHTVSFIPKDVNVNCNHFNQGDVLFTLTGENKPDIAKAITYTGSIPVAAGGDLAYWTAHGMNPFYLVYFLNSPYAVEFKRRTATGDIIVHISTGKVGNFLIPVPPLEEQNRIVDRIQEIEPYIKLYKSFSDNSAELNVSFPAKLKKSILQEAVMGKLVPQNENDEPASALLERIREEKQRLIAEGKLKKDKHESIIYRRDNSHYEKLDGIERCIDDEIPFEIPDSWEWERWGNISYSIQYGYNASAKESGRIKMVRISDIQNNSVIWDNVPYCDIDEKDIEAYLLKPNDILFARTGGTVGKSYLVTEVPNESIYAGYLIRTRYNSRLCSQYLKFFMESPLYWNQLKQGTTATAQPNCNGQTLGKMLVPIPPENEQLRIVEKIESLIYEIELL